MTQMNRSMEKKIHAVKHWLEKAEQSYAGNASIKGSLQLLLAEAEMRHLKEKKVPFLDRRLMPSLLAAMACIFIVGGVYLTRPTPELKTVEPIKVTTINPLIEENKVRESWLGKAELVYREPLQPVNETKTNVVEESREAVTNYSSREIMNSRQIEETIRAAERSLRGK